MAGSFRHTGRLAALLALLLLAAVLAGSEVVHQQVVAAIQAAEPVIAGRPVLGVAVFLGLAALSAMFIFISGLLLVPLGVQVWGELGCFLLLWAGWSLGGVLTYSLGRHLGRLAVQRILSAATMARYEGRIPPNGSFRTALLVQLAVPSDVSGYFFGLLRYPAASYLGALVVAELPYALGTVFLGRAFLEGRMWLLLAGALAALGLLTWIRRQG